MVNVDCGSYTTDGVNAIVDRCEQRLRDGGWDVDRRAHDGSPRLGDLLIGRLAGSGGRRILLVGHTDTVFDPGTARERPFAIEGSVARGPGVSDMKGGLLAGMFAVQALRDAGIDAFEHITYVCNPDEEIGSPFSGPVIRELAAEHDVGFVLEGARANGDIVSARKGITDYTLTVHGRAAHAGVEPEKGRSAIAVAADLVGRLQAPQRALARRDAQRRHDPGRHPHERGARRGACWSSICGRPRPRPSKRRSARSSASAPSRRCADVGVDVDRASWHRPMERTEAIGALAARATSFAAELGFELRDAATGGASDANTIAAAGTPVLDGLGPVGGDDHAPGEWLDVDSIVPRTAMLAALIGLP